MLKVIFMLALVSPAFSHAAGLFEGTSSSQGQSVAALELDSVVGRAASSQKTSREVSAPQQVKEEQVVSTQLDLGDD